MSQYRYDIGCTTIGPLLVVFSDRELVHVALDDESAMLSEYAQLTFKHAIYGDLESSQLKTFHDLLNFVENPIQNNPFPIKIKGTPFQQQVWSALMNIPFGETRTYSDIAAEIGKPNAVRAVAKACASNTLALLIPCHRVVAKSGKLAGYRWGIKRKQSLIAREKLLLAEHH